MAQETGGQFSSDHQELDYSPLQRDEKAHDQRMNESNARIKQAGKSLVPNRTEAVHS